MQYLKLIFLLIFSALSFPSFSQAKKEKEVTAAVERLRLAMISGNRGDLENIASEKLQYGHSGGKVEHKKDFVETIASGSSDFVTCDFSDVQTTLSKHTAIVSLKLDAKTNDNNNPGEVHMRLMTTWEKRKGKWRLLARQAVRV